MKYDGTCGHDHACFWMDDIEGASGLDMCLACYEAEFERRINLGIRNYMGVWLV